jgi:hypothetical protein
LISSALKRRTSCEENPGEEGCELLSPSSNANANRSTTDVENKKSNNPVMVLVGIRVTDKKAPSPYWRKPPHNYAGSSRLKKNLTVLKIEMGPKRRVTSRTTGSDYKENMPSPSGFGAAGRNSGGEAIFVGLLIAAAALRVW